VPDGVAVVEFITMKVIAQARKCISLNLDYFQNNLNSDHYEGQQTYGETFAGRSGLRPVAPAFWQLMCKEPNLLFQAFQPFLLICQIFL